MAAFLDTLNVSAAIWAQHPVQFSIAFVFGILVGYLLSRLRYQSTIDAQKVHLTVKDDAIKLKDLAIASASASAPRAHSASLHDQYSVEKPSTSPVSPKPPPTSSIDSRFRDINPRLISD